MKRVLAIVAVLGFAGSAYADCGECGTQECSTAESSVCEASTCCQAMEKALAQLPKMTYRVSDQELGCRCSAKQLAKDQSEPLLFVVDGETYENEPDAYVALADATESFVENFASPKTCSVSGTTTIAGKTLKCSETAKMMTNVISDAMKTVQVSYRVGEEECSCPTKAEQLAEESGEKTMYLVGDSETGCAIDARIKMAHAKYKAALEALAKLQQPAEATVES